MTGQGTSTAELGPVTVHVEVRAVNHRWLEIRARIPNELADHTAVVEDAVRRMLVRGRIDVSVRIDGATSVGPRLDVARARAAFEELTALRDALAPSEPLPLSLLGAVPGLFAQADVIGHEGAREITLRATELACAAVSEMRSREGQALALDFARRAQHLRRLVDAISARGPLVLEAARKRLEGRLDRLLESGRSPDPHRIEQEILLLADRSDVCEECTRLESHVGQLEELLGGPDTGPVGRRLEFLLQEMARESNTLGQKSADIEIARAVIDLKVEIERMREQAQNVL